MPGNILNHRDHVQCLLIYGYSCTPCTVVYALCSAFNHVGRIPSFTSYASIIVYLILMLGKVALTHHLTTKLCVSLGAQRSESGTIQLLTLDYAEEIVQI